MTRAATHDLRHDTIVAELTAVREVTALVLAYCARFDAGDAAGVAALFTDDAVVDYGPEVPPIHGADQVADRIAGGLRDLFAATSHLVGPPDVVVDGDGATSACQLHAWHRYRDGRPDGLLWGRYLHRFRRTADGWRIAALRLETAGTESFHRATTHPVPRRAP